MLTKSLRGDDTFHRMFDDDDISSVTGGAQLMPALSLTNHLPLEMATSQLAAGMTSELESES